MDAQTLVIAEEKRLVPAIGPPRTVELVLVKRRLGRVEELASVEVVVAQKLEGRAMYLVEPDRVMTLMTAPPVANSASYCPPAP